jgi:hypothetical protein
MGGVDHDPLRLRPLAGETREDAVEHPHAAPADEAVVQRLMRPVALGRVLPLQAVLDHVDDAAHHAAVVNARHPMRQRKMRSDPSHLAFAQQKEIVHQSLLERHSESHSSTD